MTAVTSATRRLSTSVTCKRPVNTYIAALRQPLAYISLAAVLTDITADLTINLNLFTAVSAIKMASHLAGCSALCLAHPSLRIYQHGGHLSAYATRT